MLLIIILGCISYIFSSNTDRLKDSYSVNLSKSEWDKKSEPYDIIEIDLKRISESDLSYGITYGAIHNFIKLSGAVHLSMQTQSSLFYSESILMRNPYNNYIGTGSIPLDGNCDFYFPFNVIHLTLFPTVDWIKYPLMSPKVPKEALIKNELPQGYSLYVLEPHLIQSGYAFNADGAGFKKICLVLI